MLKEAYGVKRIIMKTGKTDLRYGIDRLASMVRLEYGLDPLDEGTLFCFAETKRTGSRRWSTKETDTHY